MKSTKIVTTATVLGLSSIILLTPVAAQAAPAEGAIPGALFGQGVRNKWRKLSEEQRQELKEVWKGLDPEQRQAVKERFGKRARAKHKLAAEHLSTFLGISAEELKKAHQEGKRLPELLEEHDKTIQEFHAFIVSAVTKELQEKVSAGEITEARMNEILNKLGERLEKMEERFEQRTDN